MIKPIAFTELAEGTMRPVFEDGRGQFVIDDGGEPAYGVWYIPREKCARPFIVDAPK